MRAATVAGKVTAGVHGMVDMRGWVLAAGLVLAPAALHADGVVDALALDAEGRAAGLILVDGTEVELPPARALWMLRRVRRGDVIRTVVDSSGRPCLVDARTGEPVEELEPPWQRAGGGPAPLPQGVIEQVERLPPVHAWGRVTLLLRTRRGATSGFVLENGVQVRVIARVAGALEGIARGDWLEVIGRGRAGALGTGLWALRVRRISGAVVFDLERSVGAPELGVAPRGRP